MCLKMLTHTKSALNFFLGIYIHGCMNILFMERYPLTDQYSNFYMYRYASKTQKYMVGVN